MKIGKIDRLGRIVIPIEDRKSLNLKEGVLIEIHRENDKITITPHHKKCKLCGFVLKEVKNIEVCPDCIKLIKGI